MRKYWVAMLSMVGLAVSTVPAESQVVNGSKVADGKVDKSKGTGKKSHKNSGKNTKNTVKQETLRQQNQPNGQNNQLTKGNKNRITKGNKDN